MTDTWNGRPPAPLDQCGGWHWLKNKGITEEPFPMQWKSEEYYSGGTETVTEWLWDEYEGDGCPDDFVKYYEYLGPILTHDQIAAMVAEAVKAEREAINTTLSEAFDELGFEGGVSIGTAMAIVDDAIRSRGEKA